MTPRSMLRAHFCAASSESTSVRDGSDGMAPMRCTQMQAAAEAKRSASAWGMPSISATPKAAVKQSPAPVVSTTCGASSDGL